LVAILPRLVAEPVLVGFFQDLKHERQSTQRTHSFQQFLGYVRLVKVALQFLQPEGVQRPRLGVMRQLAVPRGQDVGKGLERVVPHLHALEHAGQDLAGNGNFVVLDALEIIQFELLLGVQTIRDAEIPIGGAEFIADLMLGNLAAGYCGWRWPGSPRAD